MTNIRKEEWSEIGRGSLLLRRSDLGGRQEGGKYYRKDRVRVHYR